MFFCLMLSTIIVVLGLKNSQHLHFHKEQLCCHHKNTDITTCSAQCEQNYGETCEHTFTTLVNNQVLLELISAGCSTAFLTGEWVERESSLGVRSCQSFYKKTKTHFYILFLCRVKSNRGKRMYW
ncbi:tachykinin-3 [Platysternon megacephalum]|uniref:Tachykinin-3 n=1 Tax=Platysternon megacephalum TaxID=55544 RepID=A0A4D9EA67_9SAUR|nr:tachykinin-3 [Platysternon megacephalum]